MNCTVHFPKNECEIWIVNQAMARVQAMASKATGLAAEKVIVHNHLIGGGFGRHLEADSAVRAIQIAQQIDEGRVDTRGRQPARHVPTLWFDHMSAGLDKDGKPFAWNNRFAGSSVIARWLPLPFKNGLDLDSTEGAINLVDDLPNFHVEYVRLEPRAFRRRSGAALAHHTGLRHREFHGRTGRLDCGIAINPTPFACADSERHNA